MTIRIAAGSAAQGVVSSSGVRGFQASWYVVQTKPHQEFRALEQLQNQDYDCYLPTLQITKPRRGKLMPVIVPLFSRYLFIRLDAVNADWGPIRSTRGVSSMVAFGERFATLPDKYVSALQDMAQRSSSHSFASGEQGAMKAGAFSVLHELYQLPDGQSRAFALIELMRQPRITDVFAHRYGYTAIGLRCFSVFGKRQDPNGAYAAVIPKWIAAMIRDEDVFLNGDGETSRDFRFVDNAVQASLLAATASPSATLPRLTSNGCHG